MQKMPRSIIIRCARSTSQCNFLPQSLLQISGLRQQNLSYISHEATNGTNDAEFRVPISPDQMTKPNEIKVHLPNTFGVKTMASEKIKEQLSDMFNDIHKELDAGILSDSSLTQLVKYYFDGQGKAIRPVIALTLGNAFNHHLSKICGTNSSSFELEELHQKQRQCSIISEMIHTASLIHDDVIDKADTRRGKAAVNQIWGATQSVWAGNYLIAITSKLLAQTRNADVVKVFAQVLKDLVTGEVQQLETVNDEEERFELYLNKSFNKTASLMANSCKANAILSFDHFNVSNSNQTLTSEDAYKYGKNLGIAFQLVDDLLDFKASSSQLGKPAAADLKLGLATAPVLFASTKFPELEPMIMRRFSYPGDVETSFKAVLESDGLERTKELATKHCKLAIKSIESLDESFYKDSLIELTETVLHRMH